MKKSKLSIIIACIIIAVVLVAGIVFAVYLKSNKEDTNTVVEFVSDNASKKVKETEDGYLIGTIEKKMKIDLNQDGKVDQIIISQTYSFHDYGKDQKDELLQKDWKEESADNTKIKINGKVINENTKKEKAILQAEIMDLDTQDDQKELVLELEANSMKQYMFYRYNGNELIEMGYAYGIKAEIKENGKISFLDSIREYTYEIRNGKLDQTSVTFEETLKGQSFNGSNVENVRSKKDINMESDVEFAYEDNLMVEEVDGEWIKVKSESGKQGYVYCDDLYLELFK